MSEEAEFDILGKKFDLSSVAREVAGKRVLFVGIGGGCDIITTYVMMKKIEKICGENEMKEIHYANCKRRAHSTNTLLPDRKFIYRVCEKVRPLEKGEVTYGSSKVSDSVPRNEFGCPYIFVLPRNHELMNLQLFVKDIQSFDFDVIIGIDAGGDSLTGGSDKDQRDLEMLECCIDSLSGHQKLFHFIVGPGCDGESTVKMMNKGVISKRDIFLGAFELDQTDAALFKERARNLSMRRTPNLIQRSFFSDDLPKSDLHDGYVIMKRSDHHHIPKIWLKHVIVFGYEAKE